MMRYKNISSSKIPAESVSEKLRILSEMHRYNSDSGKFHEELRQKITNLFLVIYGFFVGLSITGVGTAATGIGTISSIIFSFVAIMFSFFGDSLSRRHAHFSMYHYWRNRLIRREMSKLAWKNQNFIDNIFFESEKVRVMDLYSEIGEKAKACYTMYDNSLWSNIHIIFGYVSILLIFVSLFKIIIFGDLRLDSFGKEINLLPGLVKIVDWIANIL